MKRWPVDIEDIKKVKNEKPAEEEKPVEKKKSKK